MDSMELVRVESSRTGPKAVLHRVLELVIAAFEVSTARKVFRYMVYDGSMNVVACARYNRLL